MMIFPLLNLLKKDKVLEQFLMLDDVFVSLCLQLALKKKRYHTNSATWLYWLNCIVDSSLIVFVIEEMIYII